MAHLRPRHCVGVTTCL